MLTSMKDLNSSFSSILGLRGMHQSLTTVQGCDSGTMSQCGK